MKKVKIFSCENIISLEKDVNKWLSKNKGIIIINSNITSPAHKGDVYTFFILYTSSAETAVQEVKEMLEEAPISNDAPAIAQAATQKEEQNPTIANQLKQ